MQKRLLLFGALLLSLSGSAQLLPGYGSSRVGSTGMQFLKIGVDARGTSMAGSFAAVVNDVSALYWNPAGITQLDTNRLHFQISRTQYFAGIGLNYAGMVFRLKHRLLGVSVTNLTSGEMQETTEYQPFGTGRTFTANSILLGLTYAEQLTDNFSFGVSAKFAREAIATVSTNNALFDLGLLYNIPEKRMRFAVTLANFGFNIRPDGSVSWLKINGENASSSTFDDIAVPAIFRLAYAYDAIVSGKHKLATTVQLNHPTDNSETYSFGAEYNWNKILYLRSGYEFGLSEQQFPAAGIGIQTKRNFGMLRFDYSYSSRERLGNLHRLSVNVSIL